MKRLRDWLQNRIGSWLEGRYGCDGLTLVMALSAKNIIYMGEINAISNILFKS